MMAGTSFAMIPYRGGTTQITGLLAGDILLGHESLNVSLPLYRDGKLKILGLTGCKRLSLAPELPTIAETLPGYDLGIWQSIVAPAGTPRDVVDKLHAALRKVLTVPDVREKILAAGIEPASSATPEEFAAFIRSQADTRAQGHQGGRAEAGLSAPMSRPRASSSRSRWRRRPRAAQDAQGLSQPRDALRRAVSSRAVLPTSSRASSDQKMTERWGQPVVIENRPGANTAIGAQAGARNRSRTATRCSSGWTPPW